MRALRAVVGMIRTLVACVRAWLRSWCALWPVAWRGPQPSRYSAAGPWSPPAPSYDPLDNVPAAVGQQEEQPMATKQKRKSTKRAKRPAPAKGKARSAKSGRYVTRRHAARHPATTVTETDD